ncbi:MAG TPA: hypothetical protein QGF58_20515 [Myxococcota bacterium]|nr:hypothetical protein [Myxococcota bacterium]
MLLLSLSCSSHPCAPDELLTAEGTCVPGSREEDDTSLPGDDTGDTGEPIEWTTLPASCEAPADLPDDPLVWMGYDKKGKDEPGPARFAEWVDLDLDGDDAYAVGQGGLGIFDISDVSAPEFVTWFPEEDDHARYHRVEVLGDGILALSHRDTGLTVAIRDSAGTWQQHNPVLESGLEGLAWSDPILYTTVRGEGVRAYDFTDPENPELLTTVAGPETTWDLSEIIEGWTYAADNAGGVYPIDVSDPGNPVVHDPVPVDGATLHVEATADYLYVSNGGYGVRVLERSDPSAPTEVALVETGGSVLMTDTADGRLWAADHTGVALFDISDPTNPTWLAREVSEQFALAIGASGDVGWVGDWNYFSSFQWTGAEAGELSMSDQEIVLPAEGGSTEVRVTNRGAGVLELSGATVDSDEVTVEVSGSLLDSGQSALIRLTYGGGDDLSATLCVASNDADGPTQERELISGVDSGSYIGATATDFTLRDLEGNSHTLSEHLGHPVVLAYFATW